MDRKEWYSTDTSGGQALVIEEGTGRDVAVAYDAADAPLLAEAPAMLAALRNLLPLWSSGIDEPWVSDARAILSRIDGAPTARPAGDDPAITAAANLSRAALVEAAGEALALQAPISEAGDHCASCGAEEGESHGAQCEARGFAMGAAIKRGEG